MSYRLGMPVRKRSTPEDAVTARRVLLGGLGDGAGLFGLLGELEPLHPRNDTFLGEVFLHPGCLSVVKWFGPADWREFWLRPQAGFLPRLAVLLVRSR
jgi:hypothetical protein